MGVTHWTRCDDTHQAPCLSSKATYAYESAVVVLVGAQSSAGVRAAHTFWRSRWGFDVSGLGAAWRDCWDPPIVGLLAFL